jgi:hypothetical protein
VRHVLVAGSTSTHPHMPDLIVEIAPHAAQPRQSG